MTSEEELIQRYFDAFNRHDVEAVVACFHPDAVLVGPNGKRLAGIAEVRRSYETEFALFPDAHCELRLCTGNNGRGVAESFFRRTRLRRGRIEAIGAEVMEIVDGTRLRRSASITSRCLPQPLKQRSASDLSPTRGPRQHGVASLSGTEAIRSGRAPSPTFLACGFCPCAACAP